MFDLHGADLQQSLDSARPNLTFVLDSYSWMDRQIRLRLFRSSLHRRS